MFMSNSVVKRIFIFIAAILGVSLVTACSSSGSSSGSEDNAGDRFDVEQYRNPAVNDSSIDGLWVITGAWDFEYDVTYGTRRWAHIVRSLVYLETNPDSTVEIRSCIDSEENWFSPKTLSFDNSRLYFPLELADADLDLELDFSSNTYLSGQLIGSFGTTIHSSSFAGVKFADAAKSLGRLSVYGSSIYSEITPFNFGPIDIACFTERSGINNTFTSLYIAASEELLQERNAVYLASGINLEDSADIEAGVSFSDHDFYLGVLTGEGYYDLEQNDSKNIRGEIASYPEVNPNEIFTLNFSVSF